MNLAEEVYNAAELKEEIKRDHLEDIALYPSGKVLVIGVAYDFLIDELLDNDWVKKLIIVESDKEIIKKLKNRKLKNVEIREGDIFECCKGEEFDFVVLVFSYHNIAFSKKLKFLKYIRNLTKELIVGDVFLSDPYWRKKIDDKMKKFFEPEIRKKIHHEEFKKLLQKAGFKVIKEVVSGGGELEWRMVLCE